MALKAKLREELSRLVNLGDSQSQRANRMVEQSSDHYKEIR